MRLFRKIAQENGIVLQFSGFESHNSLSTGDRYHGPLRRVLSVLRRAHSSLNPESVLHLAVNGLNNTVGPDGLVPILLVFGVLLSLRINRSDLPSQGVCMAALRTSRDKMAPLWKHSALLGPSRHVSLLPRTTSSHRAIAYLYTAKIALHRKVRLSYK